MKTKDFRPAIRELIDPSPSKLRQLRIEVGRLFYRMSPTSRAAKQQEIREKAEEVRKKLGR